MHRIWSKQGRRLLGGRRRPAGGESSSSFISSFVNGALITTGSTLVSCALALQIEKWGHQTLFWLAPEKYAHVESAYGLTTEQLDSVRHYGTTTTTSDISLDSPIDQPAVLTSDETEIFQKYENFIQTAPIIQERDTFMISNRTDKSGTSSRNSVGNSAYSPFRGLLSLLVSPSNEVGLHRNEIMACSMTS